MVVLTTTTCSTIPPAHPAGPVEHHPTREAPVSVSTAASDAPGVVAKILNHVFGSKHYYDQGCRCTDCRKWSCTAKRELRHKRRTERVLVDGVLIHPALHPVDSDEAARHGTAYGRREFACECAPCKLSTRRAVHIGGGIAVGHTFWTLAEWAATAALLVALVVLWRHHTGRHLFVASDRLVGFGLTVSDTIADTGSWVTALASCVVAAVFHQVHRLRVPASFQPRSYL